jgi:hypothetical protein
MGPQGYALGLAVLASACAYAVMPAQSAPAAQPTQQTSGAATADSRRGNPDAPAAPKTLPRPADPSCPPDPELAQQFELVAPEDRTIWPAEVRLRIVVRADGAIECPVVIGATNPDFVPTCLDMVEGAHRPPIGEPEPRDTWITYICHFDPKTP